LPTEGTYLKPDQPFTWFNVLPPYLNAPPYRQVEGVGKDIREFPELNMWICPSKNLSPQYKSESGKNQFHYAMNLILDGVDGLTPYPDGENEPIRASLFPKQGNTVFMFDVYSNISCGSQKNVGTTYHRGVGNVLFLDGSVRSFQADDFVVDGDFKHPVPIWNHPHMYWGYMPKQE
jgi:prepilin-type processing-associated H-X9-DG protein